jgi:hypothetical protein
MNCKEPTLLPDGGADRVRTDDFRLAKAALSQLSYSPERRSMVGLGRFELPTSRLSGVRSDQLSYRPREGTPIPWKLDRGWTRQRIDLWHGLRTSAPKSSGEVCASERR